MRPWKPRLRWSLLPLAHLLAFLRINNDGCLLGQSRITTSAAYVLYIQESFLIIHSYHKLFGACF